LSTVAGSHGTATIVDNDASLAALSAERMFVSMLGLSPAAFKRQPSTVHFDCGGGCAAALAAKVADHPGRPIWIEGDLVIDADTTIGTPTDPVLIVVGGDVTLATAGAVLNGVVYTRGADAAFSGSGLLQGALIAEGRISGGASVPTVTYDAAAITRLRVTHGPMIRVPGAWNDFP
jgi:hypothetical protein